MTRIDFYVLPDADPAQRPLLACKLAEKAYSQGLKVYIHTASEQEAQQLDELLWTFRDGSFLPHAIHSAVTGDPPPILLGHDHEPAGQPDSHWDVLINLGNDIPRFFGRFQRVAELVDQRTELLAQSRERFRYYRERGYELNTHPLKA